MKTQPQPHRNKPRRTRRSRTTIIAVEADRLDVDAIEELLRSVHAFQGPAITREHAQAVVDFLTQPHGYTPPWLRDGELDELDLDALDELDGLDDDELDDDELDDVLLDELDGAVVEVGDLDTLDPDRAVAELDQRVAALFDDALAHAQRLDEALARPRQTERGRP